MWQVLKMCGSVCITIFTRLILTCQIFTFCWPSYYKLIVGNDETCLSIRLMTNLAMQIQEASTCGIARLVTLRTFQTEHIGG